MYLGLRGTKLQIAIGIIAGMDFLLFGYDQGVTGGLLNLESFYSRFENIDASPTSAKYNALTDAQQIHRTTIQGIFVATYNLGCFTGAVCTIWLGNWLGRRRAIFLGSSIMVIGAILQCAAFQFPQLIIGRFVTGLGNGLNTSTVPTWQSECSRAHRRGMLVMIEGAMITCGIMISYWLDFGFSFLDPNSVAWRFPIAFQIFFCLVILVSVMELPESPRWLMLKGRDGEARSVLAALSGVPEDDPYIDDEFVMIKTTVLEMSKGSFRDLFSMTEDRHFHRVVLAYVNQMFQQISGINLITYYIPTILQGQVGLGDQLSRLIAAVNGTEYFLASWIAVFTIERFGRRTLMIFGAAGMSISMVVLSITDYIAQTHTIVEGRKTVQTPISHKAGVGSTVFLFIFNTFFAIGWLGMTWLYPAEIVPLRIRAPANAIATSGNWIWNFMVVMITPVAFRSIGYKTYVIFAVINAFIVPVVYFFYPETANRSLEEMDIIFRKSRSIFDTVGIAKREPHRYNADGELVIRADQIEDSRLRNQSVVSAHGAHHGGHNGDKWSDGNEKHAM